MIYDGDAENLSKPCTSISNQSYNFITLVAISCSTTIPLSLAANVAF